jgi:hypothetical protein
MATDRTDYDVEAAVDAVLGSGNRARVRDVLLHPPTADEATADWETGRTGT